MVNADMQKQDNTILCFYHEYEENGYLSNWYRSMFEYAGISYSSVEQYMMYQKVSMFRQYDLAQKILDAEDPAEIKKFGRTRFPEFDAELWDKTCYAIVKRGIRAKFEQNPDLLNLLLNTEEKVLAECSAKDTKWGIGIAVDDAERYQPNKWKGKNYLGRILMEVRDELRLLSKKGEIGYKDASDVEFPLWNTFAGTLQRNPKLYPAINAYADTLKGKQERECFLYEFTLAEWELAMRTNMGGGLPAAGFWELKQDIYEILRR